MAYWKIQKEISLIMWLVYKYVGNFISELVKKYNISKNYDNVIDKLIMW